MQAPVISLSFASKLTNFSNITYSYDGKLVSIDLSNAVDVSAGNGLYRMLLTQNSEGTSLPTGGVINYSQNQFMIWISD